MRIEIGRKFIVGFVVVVGLAVLAPYGVPYLRVPEWSQGLIATLAAILVGLAIGGLISRRLSASIGVLLGATRSIAAGDLRQAVDLGRRPFPDELDDLALSVNSMLTNLRQMVAQILRTSTEVASSAQNLSATAEEINASSEEISAAMEEVARGVEHQKGGVERMAELFRELDRGLEEISSTCHGAASSAKEAEQKALGGSQTARETFEHLEGVLEGLESSARIFVAFSERIQQIHRFAEVITNLSRQTNLLALNAAIEASKAGEEGRGFAVVASEIRKLADTAEKSADQITSMLSQLNDESRKVRALVQNSTRQVTDGRKGLSTAGRALDEITGLVAENTRRIEEIQRLAREQSEGSRKITEFVNQIEAVAESNASATHEVSATTTHQTAAMDDMAQSAMSLSRMAEDLNRRVERFRVPEDTG